MKPRQEEHELEASLGHIKKTCLYKRKKGTKRKREKEREREKGKRGKRSEIPMIGLRMTCLESLVLLEARGDF